MTGRILTALLWLVIHAVQVQAAEFSLERRLVDTLRWNEPHIFIEMRGEIVEGDAERLSAILSDIAGDSRQSLYGQGLILDSPGGSLEASIALAKEIRAKGMTTYVGASKRCLSGCAVAFMAGGYAETDEFYVPRRFMHPTATLGFHAPFALADTSDIDPDVAKLLLSDAERGAALAASKLVKLAVEGILSSSLVEALLQYENDTFLYVDTVDRAGRWGINLMDEGLLKRNGAPPHPSDVALMEMHCNNQIYWRQDIASKDRGVQSKFFHGTLIFDGLDHSCKYTENGANYLYEIDDRWGGTVMAWQGLPPETKLVTLTAPQLAGDGFGQDIYAHAPPREVAGPCQNGYRWVGGWGGESYRKATAFAAFRSCTAPSDILRVECKHGDLKFTTLLLISPFAQYVSTTSQVQFQIDNGARVKLRGDMRIEKDLPAYYVYKVTRKEWSLQPLLSARNIIFWVDNQGAALHANGAAMALQAMDTACL